MLTSDALRVALFNHQGDLGNTPLRCVPFPIPILAGASLEIARRPGGRGYAIITGEKS